jgi:hypothetical protein
LDDDDDDEMIDENTLLGEEDLTRPIKQRKCTCETLLPKKEETFVDCCRSPRMPAGARKEAARLQRL